MIPDRSASPGRRRSILAGLALWSLAVLYISSDYSLTRLVWADECIYVVGARNLLERGTLDTNYYLAYSLMKIGCVNKEDRRPEWVIWRRLY